MLLRPAFASLRPHVRSVSASRVLRSIPPVHQRPTLPAASFGSPSVHYRLHHSHAMSSDSNCLFCKIIKKEIPSKVLFETDHCLAFLDIMPLSDGHTVVIPKYHAQFLHELPEEAMTDLLPTAKKVALAIGCKEYNILQNNGRLAHQAIDHVHFHVIPKPSEDEGLVMDWKVKETSGERLGELQKNYLKL